MRTDQGKKRSSEESDVERTYESVVRELRQYTSRELAILIMWPQRDPSTITRYGQPLLDLYLSAARSILRERRRRGHTNRQTGAVE